MDFSHSNAMHISNKPSFKFENSNTLIFYKNRSRESEARAILKFSRKWGSKNSYDILIFWSEFGKSAFLKQKLAENDNILMSTKILRLKRFLRYS